MADIPAWVTLSEAARVADHEEEVMTEELARHEFEDPLAAISTNSIALVRPDGSLIAWGNVYERLTGASTRRVFVWGRTHPEARGRGIGSAVVGWMTARGEEILAGQPDDLPRYMEAFAGTDRADAIGLFGLHGFAPVRWYFDMRRPFTEPLPDPVELDGLRLVCYSEGADIPDLSERVRQAHNEAFLDHWGSEPLTVEDWDHNFVGNPTFRPDLSLLVLDGDEIAAYSVNYVAEDDWAATGIRDGWVGQLGVRRAWRKRGLATALLVRSMEVFRSAGLEAATLGVDTENPSGAVGIYERVGFRPFKQSVRFRRPFPR